MTSSSDISVKDQAYGQLGPAHSHDNLPAFLSCPGGHRVQKHTIVDGGIVVPFYLCATCQVVFRFQECRDIETVDGPSSTGESFVGVQ